MFFQRSQPPFLGFSSLQEQGLVEYEGDLRAKGISEPHHLLRLTPAVIEMLIPDKPIHQRKLAALSRGRNLNAQTFSMKLENSKGPAPGGAAPFRSKSADDVLPEKPGLRGQSLNSPELAPDLAASVDAKFGDEFNAVVVRFLKIQGVENNADLKHVDTVVLMEQVKDAGGKPIQLGKLKDWVGAQAQVMPAVVEATPPPAAAAAAEEPAGGKKKPKPKRETRPVRANSTNDVDTNEVDDPMDAALTKRFGVFYGETLQSFLMTQGVLNEDDLMVRDDLKMLATAKIVGIKPVQLSKLKDWMQELKELGNGPARPVLPHERAGSKLKLTKDRGIATEKAKDYDAAVRASRSSRDLEGAMSL